MAIRLYVGGLPYATTDDKLEEYFATIGPITSAQVIFDRASGRSKGFGFVEFASDDDARKAIAAFDGQDYEGRTLSVNEAKPKEDRPSGPRSGNSSGGPRRSGGRRDDFGARKY